MTAAQQRASADYLQEEYKISQRRAARALGRSRSTLRCQPADRDEDLPLLAAIKRLAAKHPRWGYRRVWAVLCRKGWAVNIKRVRRLWREAGLSRPVRRRRPNKFSAKRGSSQNSCQSRPARFKNDVWAYDFVADRTAGGRPLRWLTLVDEYTKECLALHVGSSLSGEDVRGVLARVIGRRGAPVSIRSDNGSEFVCAALVGWLPKKGAEPIPVAPGRPWENGCNESFNSRFRDEFLEQEEFEDVKDAKEKGRWFKREYNTVRPHSALAYQTPRQFSVECDCGMHGQPAQENSETVDPQ